MEDVKRFAKSKTADRMAGKPLKLDKKDGPAGLKNNDRRLWASLLRRS